MGNQCRTLWIDADPIGSSNIRPTFICRSHLNSVAVTDGSYVAGLSECWETDTDLRSHFDDQLRHLKSDVVRLAALVSECIPRGTEALMTADHAALETVRRGASDVDRLAAAIEAEGCRLLALQQPVASDLRVLVTALRMAYELERVAGLIVDAASTIDGLPPEIDGRSRGLVEQLGELTHALLQAAVDAYVDGDLDANDRLAPVLREVADVHQRLVDHLLHATRAGRIDVEAAVQFALVGRCYERAAEHSFTIVRRVHYLVSGRERSDGVTKATARHAHR